MAQCPEKFHCTRNLAQLTSLRFTVADNAIIGVEGTHNSPDMSHINIMTYSDKHILLYLEYLCIQHLNYSVPSTCNVIHVFKEVENVTMLIRISENVTAVIQLNLM